LWRLCSTALWLDALEEMANFDHEVVASKAQVKVVGKVKQFF